jgi:hypothetical protein
LEEYVVIMDAERLVKIPRDNILSGRGLPGRPKRKCSAFILGQNRRIAFDKEEEFKN